MALHALTSHHREHLKKIGIPEPPEQLDIHPSEYNEHYANWKRTLPHASHDELHKKVLAHHAWKKHSEPKEVLTEIQTHRLELRFIGAILLLILLFLIFQPKAHAQFSKINSIDFRNNDNSAATFVASPFTFKAGANCTWVVSGTTITFNCTGGAGGAPAWDAITAPTAGGLSFQMFANGDALFTVKRKTDTSPTGSFFDFQNAAAASVCKLDITGTFSACAFPYANLTGVPSTFAPSAHNILSASHGDSTAASAVRGDGFFAIGATPTWQRLAHPSVSGGYFKWNGTDIVASTLAASGTGTPTVCTNQAVTGFTLAADAAPTSTCTTITSAFTSGTFSATAHNLLSATHGDTVAASPVRGDIIIANSTPAWTKLALGAATSGKYAKSNGTDVIISSGSASGTGACGGSQWASTLNADAAPTCTQPAFGDVSGSVAASQMPALTGAITTVAGAVATSPGKIDVLNSSAFCQAAGASSTTYTCNLSPAITAYVTGTHYRFKADVANTAASTINFNAQGAKTIKKATGGITTDIVANDLQAGQWADLVYDGTNMQMQSTLGNAGSGTGTVTSIATTSPITGGTITTTGTIACATCVTSVSGTANQIASTGGTTPVLSITNPFIFPGEATFAASATGAASFNIPSGTAPTTPVQGDIWLASNEIDFDAQTSTSGGVKLYDSGGVNAITDSSSGTITSYTNNRPLAAASGVQFGINSSNTITQSFSGDAAHSTSQTAKTGAVTTTTLCAATANTACGQAGTYRISYNFYGSGTACASVTAGSVGLNLTWTDANAVTHTTISMPMSDQKAGTTGILFNFNTALGTEGASGSYLISTNGTIIQFATTYTACTTGTGTYNLKITVEQIL